MTKILEIILYAFCAVRFLADTYVVLKRRLLGEAVDEDGELLFFSKKPT